MITCEPARLDEFHLLEICPGHPLRGFRLAEKLISPRLQKRSGPRARAQGPRYG
jgi:hypothetical protein